MDWVEEAVGGRAGARMAARVGCAGRARSTKMGQWSEPGFEHAAAYWARHGLRHTRMHTHTHVHRNTSHTMYIYTHINTPHSACKHTHALLVQECKGHEERYVVSWPRVKGPEGACGPACHAACHATWQSRGARACAVHLGQDVTRPNQLAVQRGAREHVVQPRPARVSCAGSRM